MNNDIEVEFELVMWDSEKFTPEVEAEWRASFDERPLHNGMTRRELFEKRQDSFLFNPEITRQKDPNAKKIFLMRFIDK